MGGSSYGEGDDGGLSLIVLPHTLSMTDGLTETGALLRAKREERGFSARQMSSEMGKSPTYISKVEAGDINLTLTGFCELLRHLELSNMEILYLLQTEMRNHQ